MLLCFLKAGLCGMDVVNASLYRTFKMRFDMGLFDPAENQSYWSVPTSEINTQASEPVFNLLWRVLRV